MKGERGERYSWLMFGLYSVMSQVKPQWGRKRKPFCWVLRNQMKHWKVHRQAYTEGIFPGSLLNSLLFCDKVVINLEAASPATQGQSQGQQRAEEPERTCGIQSRGWDLCIHSLCQQLLVRVPHSRCYTNGIGQCLARQSP